MNTLRSTLALSFLGLAHAEFTPPSESPFFAWLDTLGFTAINKGDFVEVKTWWHSENGTKHEERTRYGFSLMDSPNAKVVDLGLGDITPSGKDFESQFSVKPVDFESWLTDFLAEKQSPAKSLLKPTDEYVSPVDLYVLARAASARGLRKLSDRALAQASRGEPGIDQWVMTQIADRMYAAAERGLGDIALSRAQVVQDLDRCLKLLPGNKNASDTKMLKRQLEELIEEDKRHSSRDLATLGNLPVDEQIQELVFQLRNVNGYQFMHPGSVDVFNDRSHEPNIASRLFDIGLPAAPALIEALKDQRPSRSIGSSMHFSNYLSIRHVALQILRKIAGRRFQDDAEVHTWWREVQTEGEKQALVKGVERGDKDSSTQADALLKKYPDAAPAAISAGLKNASELPYTLQGLLWTLGTIKGYEATQQVEDLMYAAPGIEAKVQAAHLVFKSKPKLATEAMIALYRCLPAESQWGDDGVISFLYSTGNAEAVRALAAGLSNQPLERRVEVIEGGPPHYEYVVPRERVPKSDYWLAVEELLVSQLADTARRRGMLKSTGDEVLEDPRVCDLALWRLRQLWPRKYKFTHAVTTHGQDERRVAALNIWRRERGKPEFFLPKNEAGFLSDAEVAELVQNIVAARNSSDRTKAVDALRSIGLPAGPGLIAALKKGVPNEHEAEIQEIAREAAGAIREVQTRSIRGPFPVAITKMVEKLKGQVLTAKVIEEFFVAASQTWPSRIKEIKFEAHREPDGRGFSVVVEAIYAGGSRPVGANWTYQASVDAEDAGSYGAAGGAHAIVDPDFQSAVSEALEVDPTNPLQIAYSLCWEVW